MNKTLAIIGSHPRTREAFDFTRSDVDVWMFNEATSNPANTWAKRADVIFQMHVPAIWKNPNNRNDPQHYEWLKSQTQTVVYMQEAYPDVPMAQRYPLAEIQAMINDPCHFLTSSVPQAMALAAYLKQYERIEIYGVAMETNTEYQFQREGVSYWLGYLKGQGVDVYFADPTFQAPLYGYEGEVFIKYERFAERIAELEPELQRVQLAYTTAKGGFERAFPAFVESVNAMNEQNLYDAVVNLRNATEQLGMVDGAIQENKRYQAKADEMRAASGGEFVFSRQEFESNAKTNRDRISQFATELASLGTTLEHVHRNIAQAAKNSPKRKKYIGMYKQVVGNYLQIQNAEGIVKGASAENFMYMSYLDKHIRAAGGAKSEEAILQAVQNA